MRLERIFSVRFQNISASQDLAASEAPDFSCGCFQVAVSSYFSEDIHTSTIKDKTYDNDFIFTDHKIHK